MGESVYPGRLVQAQGILPDIVFLEDVYSIWPQYSPALFEPVVIARKGFALPASYTPY